MPFCPDPAFLLRGMIPQVPVAGGVAEDEVGEPVVAAGGSRRQMLQGNALPRFRRLGRQWASA